MKGGTALGRVLGHGSAKDGAGHWWIQRMTAVALLPLTLWFIASLLLLPGFDHASIVSWMSSPWSAVLLSLLVLCATWHSQLGVQVVIEDYVHAHGLKVASLIFANFVHVLLAVAGIFAVLKVAFSAT